MIFILRSGEPPQAEEITSGDWIYLRVGETADLIRYTGRENDIVFPEITDELPVVAIGKNGKYHGCFRTVTVYSNSFAEAYMQKNYPRIKISTLNSL